MCELLYTREHIMLPIKIWNLKENMKLHWLYNFKMQRVKIRITWLWFAFIEREIANNGGTFRSSNRPAAFIFLSQIYR